MQRLLGHSSIATTEIYTHVSDGTLRKSARFWIFSANDLTLRRTITLSTGTFEPHALLFAEDQKLLVSAANYRGQNGAKGYETHWYSIRAGGRLVCSFALRQGAFVRLSELAASD